MPAPLRLSPAGSARRRLGHPASALDAFVEGLADAAREAYDLEPGLVALAREALARPPVSLEDARGWLTLATLLFAAQRAGSTRIPVLGKEGDDYLTGELPRLLGEQTADELREEISRLQALIKAAPWVGQDLPFGLEGDWLATRRDLAVEARLCKDLRALVSSEPVPCWPHNEVSSTLEGVRTSTSPTPSDEQILAVQRALGGSLCVISGGPGTGKTSVVVLILRALVRLGVSPGEIALAAPTGKAAKRIGESLGRALAQIVASPAEEGLVANPPEARTLHRLLGYSPTRRGFRHGRGSPLAARVVIVDEASMLDLSLSEHLLAALRAGGRLILLGDADQLPSVGTGAVLRDLLGATARNEGPFSKAGMRLTRSYRMSPEDPHGADVLRLALAINNPAQLSENLLNLRLSPAELSYTGAEALQTEGVEALDQALEHWSETQIARPELLAASRRLYTPTDGLLEEGEAARAREIFDLHAAAQVLCLTRGSPTGTDAVNERLQRLLRRAQGSVSAARFAPGDKVIVTTNDYERGLFNGDVGIVLWVRGSDGKRPRLGAAFPQGEAFRTFALGLLEHELDLAFALTVHKAQGSEYERVALLLPREEIPLLSRELLYTGVSRASKGAVIWGSFDLLARGAARRAERTTGVAERLI